jgi:alpha-glucosidase
MPQYFGKLHTTEQPWSTIGAVQAIQQDERQIRFKCGDPCLTISVLAPNLIRVRMTPTGNFCPSIWAVAQADEQWPCTFEVRESRCCRNETEQLRIVVHRDPFVSSASTQRTALCPRCNQHGWRAGALRLGNDLKREHFYGFGDGRVLLDKLSKVLTNWTFDALDYDVLTDNMYQAIPFFMALRPGVGYGLVLQHYLLEPVRYRCLSRPGVWRMETQSTELGLLHHSWSRTRKNSQHVHPVDWSDAIATAMVTRLPAMSLEL